MAAGQQNSGWRPTPGDVDIMTRLTVKKDEIGHGWSIWADDEPVEGGFFTRADAARIAQMLRSEAN